MRMMTLFLAAAFSAMAAPSIAAPSDEAAILAARTTTPGTVVELARVKRGGPVSYETVGTLDGGKRADEHTVFEIGSVTKTFTATILASMVLDGSVRLDDPVQKYLPADVHMPTRNGKIITLLDLADHHSGLPRMPDNMHPTDPLDPYANYSKAQMYEFLNKLSLTRDPGAQYEYSNFGASVLGIALANRAGTDYPTLLKQRVLDPLNMHETATVLTPAMAARLAPGHTIDGDRTTLWNFDAMAPAGAIRSTASDMAKYIRCQLGEGPLAKACAFAQLPRSTMSANTHLGLVWMTGDITHITHHGGDVYGWHAGLALAADRSEGVVALTNGDTPIDDVAMHAIDPAISVGTPATFPTVSMEPVQLDQYVGAFGINLGPSVAPFVVSRDGDRIYLKLGSQGRVRIYPTDKPDEFRSKVVPVRLDFVRESGAKVVGFTMFQSGKIFHGTLASGPSPAAPDNAIASARFPPVVALDDATLASYVGNYADGDTVMSVTRGPDGIVSTLEGQPPVPVFASSKDAFFLKVVDAQWTFTRNAAGVVSAAILHQNGYDIPFLRVLGPVTSVAPPPEPEHKHVTVADASLNDYVGTYRVLATLNVIVRRENGQLVASFGGQPSVPYFSEGDGKFYNSGAGAELHFERDPVSNVVTHVIIGQAGNELDAKKLGDRKTVPVTAALLNDCAGTYEMALSVVFPATGATAARMPADITVGVQGDHLTFHFNEQPEQPIYAESDTIFFATAMDAQIQFIRDPVTHAVTGLVYSEGGHDRRGTKHR